MDRSTFVVMLARQRSGTNPLRSVLGAHPEIFCSPDIFDPKPSPEACLEVEMNYFEFLERHAQDGIKGVLTSLDAQEQTFLDYLSYLRCFSDKRYVLLDVKYNATHNVDGPWREVSTEPDLFRFVRRNGLRVLNLTWRNPLRYYLSWKKADLASQSSDEPETDEEPVSDEPSLRVPLDEMMFHLESCRTENETIARSFANYSRYKAVEYDDLFPALGPPSEKKLEQLAAWLAIDPVFPRKEPRFPEQAVRPLKEMVINLDEVARVLRGSPFEHCLEGEGRYRRSVHTAPAR